MYYTHPFTGNNYRRLDVRYLARVEQSFGLTTLILPTCADGCLPVSTGNLMLSAHDQNGVYQKHNGSQLVHHLPGFHLGRFSVFPLPRVSRSSNFDGRPLRRRASVLRPTYPQTESCLHGVRPSIVLIQQLNPIGCFPAAVMPPPIPFSERRPCRSQLRIEKNSCRRGVFRGLIDAVEKR